MIISEEAVDMVQVTVRLQVKVIKVRRLVQEHQDLVSKVARCHYIEEFLREVSQTEILRKSLLSTLSVLNRFDDGAVVTVESFIGSGIIKNPKDGVKILGNGELTKKLTVKVNAFSASAEEKIKALGGTAEVI